MYLDGGPWTLAEHLATPSFDEGLADWIRDTIPLPARDAEVIDWGCGLGLYLGHLNRLGVFTLGVEPNFMEGHQAIVMVQKDLRNQFDLGNRSDLALCLEVLEHIDIIHHEQAMRTIVKHMLEGSFLVFSGAVPGQGGQGHVAERPIWEWSKLIQESVSHRFKMVYEDVLTLDARRAATLPWFKTNILIYRKVRR